MGHHYNEPHYNEDPVITKKIWKNGRMEVKYVETNPSMTTPLLRNTSNNEYLLKVEKQNLTRYNEYV